MGIFILFYLHMIFYLSVHNNENNHTHILNNKNWILKVIVRTRQIKIDKILPKINYIIRKIK